MSFEDQLAVITPAMEGQAPGTAQAQATAAGENARATPRVRNPGGAGLDGMREKFGAAAASLDEYLPIMIRYRSNAYDAKWTEEGKADRASYRTAEATLAATVPLWSAAAMIGRSADIRFEAAMGALAAGGLATAKSGDDFPELDAEAVAAESAGFSDAAAIEKANIAAPETDGGAIEDLMGTLKSASCSLGSAVALQRARYAGEEADSAESERDGKPRVRSVLDRICAVVGSAATVITSGPGVGTVLGLISLVQATMDALFGSNAAAVRAEDAKDREHNDERLGGWLAIKSALEALQSTQDALAKADKGLGAANEKTTKDLTVVGQRADEPDQTKRGGRTKAPARVEKHAAMGMHLGELLGAQRVCAAGKSAWAGVGPMLASASTSVGAAVVGERVELGLRRIRAGVDNTPVELGRLLLLRANMEAKFAIRSAKMAESVKTVVSDLNGINPIGIRDPARAPNGD